MTEEEYSQVKDFINKMFDIAMTPIDDEDIKKIEGMESILKGIEIAAGEKGALLYKARILNKTFENVLELLMEDE
ncbi:hypothetical protein [Tetragenococcus halophilus]|uniref:hypothetical protein n=1 Tax=Tetragenococcus halophilus TaxID=51669 RepID=UPI00209BB0C4|nr:hypothetical protein [Tetragenococcus halophilus]MCO8292635.1 hypothetical protein [Tetragenococcus halophilus]